MIKVSKIQSFKKDLLHEQKVFFGLPLTSDAPNLSVASRGGGLASVGIYLLSKWSIAFFGL